VNKAGRAILLLLPLLLILGGCSLTGTSRKERMALFEVGLNDNREYLYMDFLESETADYDSLKDTDVGQTWDVWFPVNYPDPGTYTLSFEAFLDNPDKGILATVSGPSAFGGAKSLELHMIRAGLEWYLAKLVLNGSTIVQ
jgi:hypothetical protein